MTALTHSERANNDRVYVPKRPRVSRAGWPAGRALERDGAGSRVRSSWLATVLAGLVLALLGFVPTADASVAAAVPINSYDQAGYIYDGPPHTYDRLDHVALAHGIATAAVPLAPDVPAAPNPASFRAVAANAGARTFGNSAMSDLRAAAQAADRYGLTQVGRALQKHSGRDGSVFNGLSSGSATARNEQGLRVLDDILNDPAGRTEVLDRVTNIWDSTGRGVRYGNDGSFMGFLEPVG